MPVSGPQLVNYYNQQAQQLGKIIADHKGLAVELKQRDTALVDELAKAKREAAAVYLPALTDADLERAGKLTGFQGFQRRDPRIAMAQERKVLEANLADIEKDEHYQKRDTLVGQAGTLQQELDEAKETIAPLQAECEKFELLPDFLELVEVGYDTPNFKEKWWNAGYWRHWSAGDRICKQLEMNDFGDDVLPAYRKYQEPRDTLRDDIARIEREITATHQAVEQHDQLAARYQNLAHIYLMESQDFLGEHLEHADLALLEQWVANEPEELKRAVQMGLRKLSGNLAKKQFMGEMTGQGVGTVVDQLQEQQKQMYAKAQKYSRPKYQYQTFPDPPDMSDRYARYESQRFKMQQRSAQLYAMDDYYRYDLAQDRAMWWMYWWDSPAPRWMPYSYGYYSSHPGIGVMYDDGWVDYDREREREARAAAAFADRDREAGGAYLS